MGESGRTPANFIILHGSSGELVALAADSLVAADGMKMRGDASVYINFADVVLRLAEIRRATESISVVDAMRANGWTENEIGAAMDGRYAGKAMDAR